jgi:hypothetical protein
MINLVVWNDDHNDDNDDDGCDGDNKNISILHSFTCLLKNPKANYRVSRSKEKKENKYANKQKSK